MTSRESSEPDVPPTRKIITADDYDKARSKEFLPYTDFALVEGDKPIVTSEFTCPICLDLLFKTVTAKDCLHRFCSDCINMALHKGNRECPTCRSKIISKRDLRSDKRFDAIVKAMWPDRQEYARIVREYEEANQKESTDYYRALEKPDSAIVMENIRNLTKPANTHDLGMEPDEGRAKRVVSNFSKAVNLLNEDGDLEKCLNIIGTCKPVPSNKSGSEETPDDESTTSLLKTVIHYNTLEEVLKAVPMISSEEESDDDEWELEDLECSVDDKVMVSVKSEKTVQDAESKVESSNSNAEQRGLKRKHLDLGKNEAQSSQATEPETKKVKAEGSVQPTSVSGSTNVGVLRRTEKQNVAAKLDCDHNDPQSSQESTARTSTYPGNDERQRRENDSMRNYEEDDEEDDGNGEEYDEDDEEEELPRNTKFRNYAKRTVFPPGHIGARRITQTVGDRQIKIVPVSDLHPDEDSFEDEDEEYTDEDEEEFEDENEEEFGAEDEEEEEHDEEECMKNVGQQGRVVEEDYYDDEEYEVEEYDAEELARLAQQHFKDMQNLYLKNFLAGLLDSYTDKNLRWKVNFRKMFMEDPPEVEMNDLFFSYICKRRYKSLNKHPEFTAYYYMLNRKQPKDKYNRRCIRFHDLMFGDRNLEKIDESFEKTYKQEILNTSRIQSPGEFGNYDVYYNESEDDEFTGFQTDDEHQKVLKEFNMDGAYVAELKPFLQPLDLGISSCSSIEDEKTKNFVKKKVRKNRYYNSKHARFGLASYFDKKYGRIKQEELDERAKYLRLKDAMRNAKPGEESKECSEVTSENSDGEIREETDTYKSKQLENATEENAGDNFTEETGRMDVDFDEEDEGNDADDEDNSDDGSELTDDSDTMNGLTDETDSDDDSEDEMPLLDRLILRAKSKYRNTNFGVRESSDFGTDSDRETTYHNNRCGLPKVSREFMEYVQHSRIWFTILKHPYNRTKLCLKRSAKFYLRAWRDTQSGIYDAAALRGEEFLPEHPECVFPKVFYEYNTFFKSRPHTAVKRYWRSDVLVKPEFAASNRSMCHIDTIMKKSNYFGLDDYIDDEEIYVDPELYEDSCSSDSCNSDFDDDEYHDSGKYRADVDNIIKNHNFAEILEGLPDFEKHPEVMQALVSYLQ
ncbi:unnamed protein product [Auanema sp. JU1783]|nr:unnamed protein product [Auanema sp. JU1783]